MEEMFLNGVTSLVGQWAQEEEEQRSQCVRGEVGSFEPPNHMARRCLDWLLMGFS